MLSTSGSPYSWFIKYRLYHLPFWFAYHYVWFVIISGNLNIIDLLRSAYGPKFLFYVIFQALGVYFNLYFLIPRYLESGKYVRFIVYFIATIAVTTAFIASGYYVSAWISPLSFEELYQIPPSRFFHFYKNLSLQSTLASMTLGMSVKLAKNWVAARRKQQLMEKEHLETELKFLKSQFNPHFLFNTINSIFVLIHKNPAMASESLAKFSDLLRYQLYECNEQQIPLSQELSYIENFIELEKLRQDHHQLDLSVEIDHASAGGLYIAPFVLMPFLENAFKHVSRGKGRKNWISIKLKTNENALLLDIANSVQDTSESVSIIKQGGIGLKNIQRRLDLIYPDRHRLEISESKDHFHIQLRMTLENMLSVPATKIAAAS